jgi:hypothetical protein
LRAPRGCECRSHLSNCVDCRCACMHRAAAALLDSATQHICMHEMRRLHAHFIPTCPICMLPACWRAPRSYILRARSRPRPSLLCRTQCMPRIGADATIPVQFARCECACRHRVAAVLSCTEVPTSSTCNAQADLTCLICMLQVCLRAPHSYILRARSRPKPSLLCRTQCAHAGCGEAPCGSSRRPQTQPALQQQHQHS